MESISEAREPSPLHQQPVATEQSSRNRAQANWHRLLGAWRTSEVESRRAESNPLEARVTIRVNSPDRFFELLQTVGGAIPEAASLATAPDPQRMQHLQRLENLMERNVPLFREMFSRHMENVRELVQKFEKFSLPVNEVFLRMALLESFADRLNATMPELQNVSPALVRQAQAELRTLPPRAISDADRAELRHAQQVAVVREAERGASGGSGGSGAARAAATTAPATPQYDSARAQANWAKLAEKLRGDWRSLVQQERWEELAQVTGPKLDAVLGSVILAGSTPARLQEAARTVAAAIPEAMAIANDPDRKKKLLENEERLNKEAPMFQKMFPLHLKMAHQVVGMFRGLPNMPLPPFGLQSNPMSGYNLQQNEENLRLALIKPFLMRLGEAMPQFRDISRTYIRNVGADHLEAKTPAEREARQAAVSHAKETAVQREARARARESEGGGSGSSAAAPSSVHGRKRGRSPERGELL